jgi:hypothetical protein
MITRKLARAFANRGARRYDIGRRVGFVEPRRRRFAV